MSNWLLTCCSEAAVSEIDEAWVMHAPQAYADDFRSKARAVDRQDLPARWRGRCTAPEDRICSWRLVAMIRNSMRIEPEHDHPDHRFAPRRVRPVHLSGGFFTLGFALAVLAGSALFAAANGALDVAEPASASTPRAAVVQSAQPVDHMKAAGARSVVISEAPADPSNDARSAGKPLQ